MSQTVSVVELTDLVTRVFRRHGVSAENAGPVAETVVAAERDGAASHLSAAAMQPETSQADARQQPSSFPGGHAFSDHTKSKNPVEFRPWSYEFDGNRNARAMW
jgi:hypothetical protein